MRRKPIQGKRGGYGFLWRRENAYQLYRRASWRNWDKIKEDATIKSAMRVEGTAGALADRRKHGHTQSSQNRSRAER